LPRLPKPCGTATLPFFSIAAHCCSNDSPVVFNRQVIFKAVRQNLLALVKGAASQHQSFFQVA